MSEDFTKAKEIGKNMGKICSKILNTTGTYFNYAYNTISAAYGEFIKETEPTISNFSNEDNNNLEKCVDNELQKINKDNEDNDDTGDIDEEEL
tara:strand:+ start:8 stop:286 length:279 start_codon:yes stop_codon:yes gene_type:complete